MSVSPFCKLPRDLRRAVAQKCGCAALSVFLEILDACNSGNRAFALSHKQIAAELGKSQSSVERAIDKLRDAGFVNRKRRKHLPNVYSINLDQEPAKTPSLGQSRTGESEGQEPAKVRVKNPQKRRTYKKALQESAYKNCKGAADCNRGKFQFLQRKSLALVGDLEIATEAAFLVATRQLSENAFFQALEASAKEDARNPGGLFRKALRDSANVGKTELDRLLRRAKHELESVPATVKQQLPTVVLDRADTEGIVDEY